MKKKIVKAIFKGKNGSLGYATAREYRIAIVHRKGSNIVVRVIDDAFPEMVEYESVIAFLDNWDVIRAD